MHAQPDLLVAAEEQRGAAVRAQRAQQADRPRAVAKRHEVLAEQPDAHGIAVGVWHLLAQQHRHPVPPHDRTHRRARADCVKSSFSACLSTVPPSDICSNMSETR